MTGEQKLTAIIWLCVTLILTSCQWSSSVSDHPMVKIIRACADNPVSVEKP